MSKRINSKQKGKDGELEASKFLNDRIPNVQVRRTAQYNGKELESLADIVGLPGVHIEVKRVEALNIHNAMTQAIRDNQSNHELPIVMHRKNRTEWLVTMTAEDWVEMYKAYREVNSL